MKNMLVIQGGRYFITEWDGTRELVTVHTIGGRVRQRCANGTPHTCSGGDVVMHYHRRDEEGYVVAYTRRPKGSGLGPLEEVQCPLTPRFSKEPCEERHRVSARYFQSLAPDLSITVDPRDMY